MTRNFIPAVIIAVIAVLSISALMTGCERPRVGSANYQDPLADPSPYEPAEEFKYLVDLKSAENEMIEAAEQFKDIAEASGDQSLQMVDLNLALSALGILGFVEDELMAEANESMVHAHSAYTIPGQVSSAFKVLNEVGAAEVKLPAHFPSDRWLSHIFLANPGHLVDHSDFSIDSMAAMYGFDSTAEIYEWLGDEMVIFSLTNPDFDSDAEPTPENMPFYSIMAVSSNDPEAGIDVLDTLLSSLKMIFGSDFIERTEFEGHDALIMSAPSIADSPLAGMMSEEEIEQMEEQMLDLPPTIALAVDDYLFLGDQPSVESALEIFDPRRATTQREASIEVEANWDQMLLSFVPASPGVWLSMLGEQTPEVAELFQNMYEATADIQELGTSRLTITAYRRGVIEIDLLTSRESLRLYGAVQEVIENTPEATWESIGHQMGEALAEQQQQDGFGGQEYDFDFGN